MHIIEQGHVQPNPWTSVGDSDPLPPQHVLVSLRRFVADHAALQAHGWPVGVVVHPTDPWREHITLLAGAPMIAIVFQTFADGRGYSIARHLRDHAGYRAALWARGDILRDQIYYYRRCGFDVFDVPTGQRPEDLLAGWDDFSVAYQPTTVNPARLGGNAAYDAG